MTWVAVAIGGAALIGGVMSSNASNNATNATANAANQANATQWAMYDQNRTDQAPWRTAGGQAVGQMAAGLADGGQFSQPFSMADYQADPGYAFRLQQGQQALDRAGASTGRALSGAQMKAGMDYNSGAASQEYGNAYNRFMNNRTTNFGELSNLAGLGQSSVGSTGQAGTQTAQITGNNTTSAAGVAANAGMANASNWTNALNNGINTWQGYNLMQNMGQTNYMAGLPYGTGQGTVAGNDPNSAFGVGMGT